MPRDAFGHEKNPKFAEHAEHAFRGACVSWLRFFLGSVLKIRKKDETKGSQNLKGFSFVWPVQQNLKTKTQLLPEALVFFAIPLLMPKGVLPLRDYMIELGVYNSCLDVNLLRFVCSFIRESNVSLPF